jgi:hypothetical protein
MWNLFAVAAVVGLLGGAASAMGVASADHAPGIPDQAWRPYNSDRYAFSISFPGAPTETDDTQSGSRATAKTMFLIVMRGSEGFSITAADFRWNPGQRPKDLNASIDYAVQGVWELGKMHSFRKFRVRGGVGRETIVVDDNQVTRTMTYEFGYHTYVVAAASTHRQDIDALYRGDFARFFNSFRPHAK